MPASSVARNGTPAATARAFGPGSLRRGCFRHVPQPRPHVRGHPGRRRDRRRGGRGAYRAFSKVLPALRRRALRNRLPDRRVLQARRGRHRAGRRGHVHRLRPVRLGLSLWRARNGSRGRRDEEMHALRRPHLQRDHPGDRPDTVLRADLSGERPPLRRSRRSAIRCLDHGGRARRHGSDAGAGHTAGQQIPAAAPAKKPCLERRTTAACRKHRRREGVFSPGWTACWTSI